MMEIGPGVWRLRGLFAITLGLSLAPLAGAASEPTCWRMGSGQYFTSLEYCVSSVQASRGAANFGPRNLLAAPGSRRAWCSALDVDAAETWITIAIESGAEFRQLLISNGYSATPDIHARHGRIKELKMIVDSSPAKIITLADKMGLQTIDIGETGKFASVRLEMLSHYPGTSATNVCLDYLTPDFEDLERSPPKRP